MKSGEYPADRGELIERLSAEARASSTATVMFHHAIAERLGLNTTDHKCADIIAAAGVLTAGELAERVGLTTGAVTGVLDRLEERGFVRRERDAKDRRRVLVYPVASPDRDRIIGELFTPLDEAWKALCRDYSEKDLALVLEFLSRSRRVVEEETQKLVSS